MRIVGDSGAEAGGAADEGIAALVEAERLVGSASDADARAYAEIVLPRGFGGAWNGYSGGRTNPEGARRAEVNGVEAAVNLQSGGQAAGTPGEIENPGGSAVELHLLEALERLEGADQDSAADAGKLAAHVEHKMIAVAEINIGMSAAQEHRTSARSGSAKMMRGWIAGRIRFGLDDATGNSAGGEFADDDLADQEARQCNGACGKLGAMKAANVDGMALSCGNRYLGDGVPLGAHGIPEPQSGREVNTSNFSGKQGILGMAFA